MIQTHCSAFGACIAPARPKSQFWRLLTGSVLCLVIYAGFIDVLFGLLILSLGVEQAARTAQAVTEAKIPTAALMLLFTFSGMALGPVVAVRLLHKCPAGTLFGPRARTIRDFAVAAGTVAPIYGLAMIVWTTRYDAVPQLDLAVWLSFLPLAIVALLIQTGAEELVFRGYLLQQLATRFRSPLIWMVLPGLAFGLVHYDPATGGDNVWPIVALAGLLGLVAADLTAVTGSLGAVWGFHFANNFAALLIVAVDGTIPGLALYLTPCSANDVAALRPLILGDLPALAVAWFLVRRMLRR